MTQEKILEYAQRLVASPDVKLRPESVLITNGLIDSFAVIDLLTHLEQEFSVKFTNEEMIPANFDSVNAMVSLIERKKKAAA